MTHQAPASDALNRNLGAVDVAVAERHAVIVAEVVGEHQSGAFPGYTWSRRPLQLVWSEHFDRITDAIAVERKLKGWSRSKKQALINSDWAAVQKFAKWRAGKP